MMNRTKKRKWLQFNSLLALPFFALPAAPAVSSATQNDAKALIASACAAELASDRSDHTPFMYKDHDVTPDHDTLFSIIETPEGNLRRKLEDHGHPLSAADKAADDASIQKLLGDPALQKKLRKDSAHDDDQAEQLMNLLPTAFLWTIASDDGDLVTLNFKPDPRFEPPNMEARVFSDMQGQVVLSRKENRIHSMRGTMVDDVKIAWGMIGKLHKGGTFQIEHREVAPHHWQLTELHVHIVGKILFNFKTIGSEEDEFKTDFRISPAKTLQQAWEIMNPPPPRTAASLEPGAAKSPGKQR
jgi:hypothetical protein